MANLVQKLLSPPYILAGMHRSGTSFLSKAMIDSGVFMGKHLDVNSESIPFIQFNEKIFEANKISWDAIGEAKTDISFQYNYLFRHFFKNNLKGGLSDILRVSCANKKWGWKDPRNTINILYWLKIFPKAKIVFIYRNGFDVASSLLKRNNSLDPNNRFYSRKMDNLENTFQLWEEYNNYFFGIKDQIPKDQLLLIKYESILSGEKEILRELDRYTDLELSKKLLQKGKADRISNVSTEAYPNFIQNSECMKRLGYID